MMNRNIINYQHSDNELFEPKYIMTKNEDEFNWSKLIPNDDFSPMFDIFYISTKVYLHLKYLTITLR